MFDDPHARSRAVDARSSSAGLRLGRRAERLGGDSAAATAEAARPAA